MANNHNANKEQERAELHRAIWQIANAAITSGSPKKMAKRAGRRMVGKATGRAMRKLFK